MAARGRRRHLPGTVDARLLLELHRRRGVYACDVTNASRTQLFNPNTLEWDDDLLAIFGIRGRAAGVRLSSAYYGETHGLSGIPAGLPITLIGDSTPRCSDMPGFRPVRSRRRTDRLIADDAPRLRGSCLTQRAFVEHRVGHRQVTYALEGNIYVTGRGGAVGGRYAGGGSRAGGCRGVGRRGFPRIAAARTSCRAGRSRAPLLERGCAA